MKKVITINRTINLKSIFYAVALSGMVVLINGCQKNCPKDAAGVVATKTVVANNSPAPVVQDHTVHAIVNVAAIRKAASGTATEVMFYPLAQIFATNDPAIIESLQQALNTNSPIKVSFNPWTATVLKVATASAGEADAVNSGQVIKSQESARRVDMSNIDVNTLNNPPEMAVINTTTSGLTSVIPDMATAQQMFDYIAHQCCALSGPYAIDHCISFQYCEDGCYARAHKMCWILNNTYHYATHKIFSFANAPGASSLSVKAEKWGGCCINWWYHVAPIVNIKTPSGTKAYVFDPAMFDQPVLLATWLHAQANPACASVPHVDMINIQPTTSYAPSGSTGYLFSTDPFYSSTNSTLTSYAPLISCP